MPLADPVTLETPVITIDSVDYVCAARMVRLVPKDKMADVSTFCNPGGERPSSTTWTLDVEILLSFGAVSTGTWNTLNADPQAAQDVHRQVRRRGVGGDEPVGDVRHLGAVDPVRRRQDRRLDADHSHRRRHRRTGVHDRLMAQLKVVGLTELRKALRKAGDKEFANELRKANTRVAEDVLRRAQPGIAGQSTKVAASGRAVRSAVGGKIAFDEVRSAGVIFGAHHDVARIGPKRGPYKGFNAFRPANPQGYHVYPEVDESLESIADIYMTAVDDYMDSQGVLRA